MRHFEHNRYLTSDERHVKNFTERWSQRLCSHPQDQTWQTVTPSGLSDVNCGLGGHKPDQVCTADIPANLMKHEDRMEAEEREVSADQLQPLRRPC